jgi:hypothetical protein
MNIAGRNLLLIAASLTVATISSVSLAIPTVYPTGTTIYQPDKTWNGYTVFSTAGEHGSVLIDMNGNEVRRWSEIGAGAGGPARILPGGYVVAGYGERTPYQESIALMQLDWEGNEVWRFDGTEEVRLEDGETVPGARQHHDWQREGNPVGYYAPDMEPSVTSGHTLILAHKNVTVPEISDKRLEDDFIIEVSWDGEILWEWLASDHVEELGFSEDARNAIYRSVSWNDERKSADWLHINAMAYVGPNHWYDDGDARFHPDNIIFSSREWDPTTVHRRR